jgi:hypothetical protein
VLAPTTETTAKQLHDEAFGTGFVGELATSNEVYRDQYGKLLLTIASLILHRVCI